MSIAELVNRPSARVRAISALLHSRTGVCLGLLLLVGTGIARIAATYQVFNQTFDEPLHLACGMEWWDHGRYLYERQHPPLARIAIALGPYLDELHSMGHDYSVTGLVDEGNDILYSRNTYWRNLTLARAGILPFFIIASLVVWYWSDRVFGRQTAWVATFLFTTLPPVLGHSAVATTDIALTAFIGLALYAFMAWWEQPGVRQTLGLGAAVSLAILSKFTAFLFLPPCALSILAVYAIMTKTTFPAFREHIRSRLRPFSVSLLVAVLLVWSGYRFSVRPALKPGSYDATTINKLFGTQGRLHDLAVAVARAPLPMADLLAGLVSAEAHARSGYDSYLLGSYSTQGWWYYFPVALAVKTPLAFLVLIAVGFRMLLRRAGDVSWKHWVPLCCATAILLVCLASPITIGVRHILPIYPLLAIVAGFAFSSLLARARSRWVFGAAAGILLGWHSFSSIAAHPNYIAYFNEIAARHPERFLADSNLDWGQDLQRLSSTVHALGIHDLTLSYFGTALPDRHDFPSLHPFVPYQPTAGWIAVSLFNLKVDGPSKRQAWGQKSSPYAWLDSYKPVTRIGQSIELYYIPDIRVPKRPH